MSDTTTVGARPMRARTADEIRVQLALRRMSGSELARRVGMTQPYISRRLTGEIAFDVDDLEKIAAVLGVDPADLLPSSERVTRKSLSGEPTTPHPVDVRSPRHRPAAQAPASDTGAHSGSRTERARRVHPSPYLGLGLHDQNLRDAA